MPPKKIITKPEELIELLAETEEKGRTSVKKSWQSVWEKREDPACFVPRQKKASGTEIEYRGLPTEAEITAELFRRFLCGLSAKSPDFSSIREEARALIRMRQEPVPVRAYSEWVKELYIRRYYEEGLLAKASDKEILLYVLYTDELAGRDNLTALRAKAEGLAKGDRAYAQNVGRARDLNQRLLRVSEDPAPALLLGDLYYSGKLSGGKADFAKAFYYYSIAAAGGMRQAMLALADMFSNGQGVDRNESIGRRLKKQASKAR